MVYNLAETLKKMEEDVMLAKAAGKAEGIAEGKAEERLEIAKKMLVKNSPLDFISEVTGLSIDEIKALQVKSNDKIH